MAEHEVGKTIQLYESLVNDFPSSESWAINILTACKGLTSGIAHTNFYRYLFDPENYSFQANVKTIGPEEEEKYNQMVAEFDSRYPHKVDVYRNGNDLKIICSKRKQHAEETKPLDCIPSQIQSPTQKQVSQHETGNVRSSEIVQEEEQKIDD